jgi:type I restriction enzyme R subunit
VTIDWARKTRVRAEMRNRVRRLLRRHKYPPDKEQEAIDRVLEQTEASAERWVE